MGRDFVSYSRVERSTPTAWHAPTTEDEVVAAVRAARRLKVVGARHSFSGIAVPEGEAMTLDNLSGITSLDRGRRLVTARAGTRLRDLTRSLHAQGWTLPILGSIQAQSIAGAIATGTHGSSLVHGNLASLVHAMRLVDGAGTPHELGPDEPRLDGTRVHLGALGVVTEVTLRIEPAFRLRQEVEHVPVREVDVVAAAGSAEYVKVWWLPGASHAQVVRYHRTDEPLSTRPSAKTLRRFDDHVMHRALYPLVVAWQHRRPRSMVAMNQRLQRVYLGPPRLVGQSTVVLNTPMPVRHRETEAAVPVSQSQRAFDAVVDSVLAERLGANFPFEVRFVRADQGWLSPAHGEDVCQLGAYSTDGPHRERFFALFWECMAGLDARPHWGKELHHSGAQLRPHYPRYDDFLALRDELDPERVFDNAFLRQALSEEAIA